MAHFDFRTIPLVSSVLAMSIAAPVFAQAEALPPTAPAAAAASTAAAATAAESDGIQDIVVTARRREESLQSAPVTVTAFSGAALQAKGINDFSRLAQATPGINFDAFPRAAPRPFFRGIGSANQGAGGDPSSVAFLDGVYLGRAAMLGIDFFDMQRVEVLKGPQGTLFGKNVVGGAINFITAKPIDDFEAVLQLTAGEYEQRNVNAMINVPVTDRISTRLVVGLISNDGFRHTPTGKSLDDEDKKSVRLQTLFDLGDDTSLLLSGDIARQNLSQGSRYNVRTLPFNTGKPRGYDDFDKPRVADPDRPGFTDSQTGGLRAEFNKEIAGFATLTATAAWRGLSYDSSDDLDGSNAAANARAGVQAPAIQTLAKEHADSYSAETRLASLGGGPFTWVTGLYYNHDKIRRERESETAVVDTSENRFIGSASNHSYAAFGEAQYKFDFGLGVFGGARYTDEKKVYGVTRLVGNPAAPTVSFDTNATPGKTRQRIVTYRVGADYRLNDNIFGFATVSTGFKSGAFQEQPGSAALARTPTAPEKVTNYETGVKTDWLDRRLRVNVSAFIAKYRDFQTIQNVPDATAGVGGSSIVTDTGNATIKGIETEFVLAPAKFIDLTVRYTYLDATFDSLTQTSAILANGTAVRANLAGSRLSRTPKNAVVADLGLNSPKADWGWLRGSVTMDYQSQIYDDNANDFIEYRRPRTLWDASLTYHRNDRFSAQVWVRNLTDKEYRTYQVETGGGLFVQYGNPRQFGVTLNGKF